MGKLSSGNEETEIVKEEIKTKVIPNKTVEVEPETVKVEVESSPAFPEGEFKINETRVVFVKRDFFFINCKAT